MNDKTLVRDSIAELIGTFMLVLFGAGAGALAQPVYVVALAHGLTLIAIIYTYGHFSGAHVNPAVTMAQLVGNKIDLTRAAAYWVAQFVGGILAALALKVLVPVGLTGLGETTGSLTTAYPLQAYLIEGILAFILASVVTQAAVFNKAGFAAGLGIGLTLAACILFAGPLTGGSVNPARTLGPALVAGNLSYVPGYIVALLVGGALAGFVQYSYFRPHVEPEVAAAANKRRR